MIVAAAFWLLLLLLWLLTVLLSAAAPAPSVDWTTKCLHILQQVVVALAGDAWIFKDPVDAKAVPDYYRVIKNPMTLGQVDSKLRRAQYGDPSQFYDVSSS